MASEDSLNDQGDIPAETLYTSLNIPTVGTIQQGVPAVQADTTRGWTTPAIITDTARVILPANPNRKFLLIQNADAIGNIFIAFGIDAALTVGIKAASGGGGLLLDNNCPTSSVSIIGDIALNPNVTIVSA